MPECHKCTLNGTGSEACLTCKGPPETNHHGKTHVSLDSEVANDPQTGAEVEASMTVCDRYEPPCIEKIDLPDCCADTARRLLAFLSSLEASDLSLVIWRAQGRSLAAWGRRNGFTRQYAHHRYTLLSDKEPVVKGAFG